MSEGSKKKSKKVKLSLSPAVYKEYMEAPHAPPLSEPIPFLEGKLNNVKLYFRQVPDGFEDWTTGKAVHTAFPPIKGGSTNHVPQALIQDCKTDQDKLVVISWWRFLPKEEQQAQYEALKRIYAAPKKDNRKLPPDFWEKLKEREEKRAQPKVPKEQPIDPTGNDFYVYPRGPDGKPLPRTKPVRPRQQACRGWKGESFDKLFQGCFVEAMKNVTMVGGAKVPDTIPVIESVARTKNFNDLHFVKEGDDFVLRSVGCTKKRTEDKKSQFCESCSAVMNVVSQAKRNRSSNDSVEAKQKQQITKLKSDLKSALRREKRLREKLGAPHMSKNKSALESVAATAGHMGMLPEHAGMMEESPAKRARMGGSPQRAPMPMAYANQNHNFGFYGGHHGGNRM